MQLPSRRGFAGGMIATLVAPLVSRGQPRSSNTPLGSVASTLPAIAPPPPTKSALIRPPLVAPALNGDDIFKKNQKVVALIQSKPMLRGLDILLYEHIRNAINSVASGLSPYNPFLYEALLTDCARLLDRCFAYRRECCELEAQAVRRALEFDLIGDLYPMQKTLQNTLTDPTALAGQRDACDSAGDVFQNTDGFKVLYKKTATAIAAQETLESSKRVTLGSILDRAYQHQQTLEARHSTPGHSLNYAERRERMISLIVPDVVEAYLKAKAAKAGFEFQLGVTSDPTAPFPQIANDQTDVLFLDKLALWARSLAQNYELLRSQDEAVFDRVIPLTFPWSMDLTAQNPKTILSGGLAAFTLAMQGDGKLTFNLSNALPSATQVDHLRVRAIGLSIGVNTDFWTNYPRFAPRTWCCEVFPPTQRDPQQPTNAGATITRMPVVLGRVGIYRGDVPLDMNSGPGIWNVDPRAGDWTIVVDRLTNHLYSAYDATWMGTWPRAKDLITDIKVHLRMVGKPSTNPNDWIPA